MPYLTRFLGSLTQHMNYQKFIILGRSRSGSNFLRGLLNSHSQVRVFGEIFQNKDQVGWAMDGYPQDARTIQEFRNRPVEFLQKRVFTKFPRAIHAVGFKIFYYHARDEQWQPVWEYLKLLQDLKIIHIKRQNILETHLSRQRALQTDRWFNLTGERDPSQPLSLDFQECLQDFQETRRMEGEAASFFSDHPVLDVLYEELSRDQDRVMGELLDFLNVRREPLTSETFKQSNQSLSMAIANYAELKEKFQGTPWIEFFSD